MRALPALSGVVLLVGLGACERPPLTPDAGAPALPDVGSGPDVFVPAGICEDQPSPDIRTLETDERVATVLAEMSLTEKIEQMAGYTPESLKFFDTPDNERLGIRGFRFRDGPRGVRLENGNATCFPAPVGRAATWDTAYEEAVGEAVGREVKALGHNFILAPTINTLRHPGWGRGQETYGEDPWFLGTMGIAFVTGAQRHVPANAKHYAGNNIEDTRHTNNAVMDPQTLRENYLRQFRMLVERADVASVMAAYNKANGFYCCENLVLLRNILKTEWGFDGLVVSDWFATKTTVESALAGLDVEMPFRDRYAGLELAVTGDQVNEELIDQAVTRILRIKYKFGLADLAKPFEGDPEDVESAEHVGLALRGALEGTVLLKNDGQALPIDRASVDRIAVIGKWAAKPRLGDNGSSNVFPSYAVDPYNGIANRAGDGVEVVTSPDISAAAGADVVVVVGALSQADEGEAWNGGGDRDDLGLAEFQEELILEAAAGSDRVIVVLEAGGPITMESWKDEVEGIVMAWYPGMEGGHAVADLLFGDANFAGRLPQTWPVKLEAEPVFGNHQDETVYDYFHGYRHFDEQAIEPLFPFGFGLSYTSFEVSNLGVPCEAVTEGGRLVVTVDVTNTGAREGVAVPQAYVAWPESAARRSKLELKGFGRVELDPGETATVEIPIRIADLAWWDTDASAWVIDHATHEVHVGQSARDLPLVGTFRVAAEGVER